MRPVVGAGRSLAFHTTRAFNLELAAAIDDASPELQRRASILEARRQCRLARVAHHPLLAEMLAGAEQGETMVMP
ncbi:hypothetical protein N5079_30760 [Planotetraspora sp. A-T 1434]|uniref:hypothetical protein n=1 Tax=Planotetraspora sp. A-T 1434 TaxID=2979219 RepID=UPI0021C05BAF|nr:hypothetical protein [Planotetraspora sp. A-T 1434]MCT9934596.1 hypothetical protein [Planotetraspora sp. A-T 1434]